MSLQLKHNPDTSFSTDQREEAVSVSGNTIPAPANSEACAAEIQYQEVTATDIPSDGSGAGPERSSISVIFTDWVPSGDDSDKSLDKDVLPDAHQNIFNTPVFPGGRPRYFQLHRGHRPGLGMSVHDVPQGQNHKRSKHKKRKHPSPHEFLYNESLAKRLKITPEKPASQIVHEIDPNLQYSFEEGTKNGIPHYTCTIIFPSNDGTEYVGEGRSKKVAKNDAAEKVLVSLGVSVEREELVGAGEVPRKDNNNAETSPPVREYQYGHEAPIIPIHRSMEIDFASDDMAGVNFGVTDYSNVLSQPMVDASVLRRLRNIPNFEENVALALNTMFPGAVEYEILNEVGPSHDKTFTVKVSFNNQEFIDEGSSKKKAKANVARKALITLLGPEYYSGLVKNAPMSLPSMPLSNLNNERNTMRPTRKKKSKSKKSGVLNVEPVTADDVNQDEDDGIDDQWGEYDLNFSDHVSNLVREKYEDLVGKDSSHSSFKVLAGVVMTTSSPMIYNSKVIAVTTGTKCIEGDFMSEQGLSVNDCHAEILATRCVRDFLYSQIELMENAKADEECSECILEANDAPGRTHKYALKPDIKFHLYISTSPCGDARIFSPKGIEIEEDAPGSPADMEDTHPNKLNRGVLRSKIEAGEGTIPSANLYKGPQTWDSIVSGNALYTMSCSDKVCRWNVLGLQGALLYNFIGLIHYSSITLGSLHHPVHFTRAVYGRVEPLNSRLEMPFSVHKPKLMMVSREEKRRVKKSPNHAVCWAANWSTAEILAASKGRCEQGGVASRLTKRMSFSRFLKLYKNEGGKRENYADLSYHEAKQISADYQKAKEEFISFFKDSNLGPWIGKPIEQDSFKIK